MVWEEWGGEEGGLGLGRGAGLRGWHLPNPHLLHGLDPPSEVHTDVCKRFHW